MRYLFAAAAFFLMMAGTAPAQETWTNYGRENVINDVAVRGDYIWCATANGLVRWDRRDMSNRRYTMRDGLPHSIINSIDIAPDGAVWCGTVGGVARFDGSSWRVFRRADGLPNTSVSALTIGPDLSVWAGTRSSTWMGWFGGLSRYDGSAWTTLFENGTSSSLFRCVISAVSIAPDTTAWLLMDGKFFHYRDGNLAEAPFTPLVVEAGPDGTVWAGTSEGVKRYDGAAWSDAALPSPHPVSALTALPDGMLWAGAAGGLLRYNGGGWSWHAAPEGMIPDSVRGIAVDDSGTVWIGAAKGLVQYDGAGFRQFRTEEELPAPNILSLAFEPSGAVWVGTTGGLSRYDGKNWRSFTTADGLPDSTVTAIAITSGGEIWAGTPKGVARYNGSGWKTYTTAHGLVYNAVNTIACGRDDRIWVGTDYGMSSFFEGDWQTFSTGRITSLAVTADGSVYAGSGNDTAVQCFNGGTGGDLRIPVLGDWGFSMAPRGMCAAPGINGVYVGGYYGRHGGRALTILYAENTTAIYAGGPGGGLSGHLSSFAFARDGTMWIGSVDDFMAPGPVGVIRFKGKEQTVFTVEDGLTGFSVNVIAIAPDGAVWCGTEGGLSRLSRTASTGTGSEPVGPEKFAVISNSPNPFNPSTTISFTLPRAARVELAVYSITGQKVRTLFSGPMTAGAHSAVWDGKNDAGKTVSSGIYIAQLHSGKQAAGHKMLFMK